MSKYKAGDKVVVEIEKAALTDNGGGFYTVLDYMQSAISVDEKSEPLSTYTEPLEAKIRRQAAEITRLLIENKELKEKNKKLLCKVDSYELYGDQHEEEYNQAFNQGAEEAWELAKKINDMDIYDTEEIFIEAGAFHLGNVLENYTYQEAAAKVAEWEKAKEEIKVGDVVRNKPHVSVEFCVTQIDYDGYLYGVGRGGATYSGKNPEYWEKTGRQIDIDNFLKQIRGEE